MASPEDVDSKVVNLLDLAASCLSSAIVAADQITNLACTTNDHARLKIDGSFVTDADMAAQQIIVDALRKVSSGVRIVGEENEEEMRSRAITGHESKLETIFQLARKEIHIRYNGNGNGNDKHQFHGDKLPLAQLRGWCDVNKKFQQQQQQQQKQSEVAEVVEVVEESSLAETIAKPSPPDDDGSTNVYLYTRDMLHQEMAEFGEASENHRHRENQQLLQARLAETMANPSPPEEEDGSTTPNNKIKEYEIDTHRVSVFIDPLDGTNSYAKGDYDPVSILVAIVVDQTPVFGVIGKPFGYPGQTSVLDTGCVAVYGGTLLGDAYIAGGDNIRNSKGAPVTPVAEDLPEITSLKDLPRAVISKSRSNGIVQDFVTHLGKRGMIHPEPLLVSGAGEKSLRIITRFENEGLWFFPKGGTSLWDVAASDALLRATGGRLTDKYGKDMDYSKSRTEAENENGVVACYDQRLHAECIRLFLEGSWQDKD